MNRFLQKSAKTRKNDVLTSTRDIRAPVGVPFTTEGT